MTLTKEQEARIRQGKAIIAERNLATMDDFLRYFETRTAQNDALEAELEAVRVALPPSIWTTIAREPWKYSQALFNKRWENPGPDGH